MRRTPPGRYYGFNATDPAWSWDHYIEAYAQRAGNNGV
jgi:hypothetical protein